MTAKKEPALGDITIIARAAYEAYVASDRAAIEKLIAPEFHFTSPLDNRLDRATYLARCWPNNERIEGFDFINFVPDGDRVFVTYEGRTDDGEKFRNTEIVTVRDGQINEVEVYFGWSIPHKAKPGCFIEDKEDSDQQNILENMTIENEFAEAVVIERTFNASVAQVWKALTDAKEMRSCISI